MLIPKKAKRVFKGVIFDVYQWEQLMFDGKYETFERLRRTNTVQVIATKGNKVLMLKERQPALKGIRVGMPGGQVDAGETPLKAAKRELLEEAGLVSDNWKLLNSYNENSGNRIEWTVMLYVAKNCRKIAEPKLDGGEKIECIWVSPETLLDSLGKRWDGFFADLSKTRYDSKRLKRFKQSIFK